MHTLEEVVDAFATWRANRGRKKEPIPDRLWALTKALLPYYKKSHIQRALKVSGSQLNEYCIPLDTQKRVVSTQDGFAVGTFKLEYAPDDACELILSGKHKSLQIKTNIHNMSHVLSLVEGYL
jgi:hypothetical protein